MQTARRVHPGLSQPCSPTAIAPAAVGCGISSTPHGSLGPRLLKGALKTLVRTLEQITGWEGAGCACYLRSQGSGFGSAPSGSVPAVQTHLELIGNTGGRFQQRQERAGRLGTCCPYPPVTLVEARVGGLRWHFPHSACIVNFPFPGCQDKVFHCNYGHVLFSCNRVARLYFRSNHTVPTRRRCSGWWQPLPLQCCFSALSRLSLSTGHVHGRGLVWSTGLLSSNSWRWSALKNCLGFGQDFWVNPKCR